MDVSAGPIRGFGLPPLPWLVLLFGLLESEKYVRRLAAELTSLFILELLLK
jgi:hypothetical protein